MDVLVAGGHGQIARRLLRLLAQRRPHAARADPQPRPRRRPRGRRRPPGPLRPRARRRAPARRRRRRDRVRRRCRPRQRRRAQADAGPRRRGEVHRGRAGARRRPLPDRLLDGHRATPTPTARCSPYFAAKRDADRAVEASGLAWTIVRPGRLTNEPGHRDRRPRAALGRYGEIPRDDVALVLYHCLLADNTIHAHVRPAQRRRARRSRRSLIDTALTSGVMPRLLAGSIARRARPRGRRPPTPPRSRKARPGDAFYTPPASLPSGRARHADLAAQADRRGGAQEREDQHAAAVPLDVGRRQGTVAVSGTVAVPKGKAPKGGWPVVSWAHGTIGIADACAPSNDRHARRLRPAAAQPLAEGRLRGRAHGLRRPRHAGRRTRT